MDQMVFKYIAWDTQPLAQSMKIFQNSEAHDKSVREYTEDQILRWMFNKREFGNYFLEDFFQKPYDVCVIVGEAEPFVKRDLSKPGDLDLLLLNKTNPAESIAIECKRIKALYVSETDKYKTNKIDAINEGIIQANSYRALGFHRTYLMIILLDDSREKETPNAIIRNSKTEDIPEMYSRPWTGDLHDDIGIIYVRVDQTTGRDNNLQGGMGFCVDREARRNDQSLETTEKVREYLRSKNM